MFLIAAAMAVCEFPDERVCDVAGKPSNAAVTQSDITATKAHFEKSLFDGPAARWQFAYKASGHLVCGFVNGKNRLGAYTGWQPFYFDPTRGTGTIFANGERLWLWDTLCLGPEYMDDHKTR